VLAQLASKKIGEQALDALSMQSTRDIFHCLLPEIATLVVVTTLTNRDFPLGGWYYVAS
jgi:hypothetical protein